MTTAEILRAAKAHLIERGWCQGDELAIHAPEPRKCCAATAMGRAMGNDLTRYIVTTDLFRSANGIIDQIADWNDAPERTLDEVLAAFDKAITAADLAITADELRAMPMPKAVVAFLRACRTSDEVGDVDGPWFDAAKPFLCNAAGVTGWWAYLAWECNHSINDFFAVMDKAIAAAEAAT